MTAKSPRRRPKRVYLASMETLGFFDTPGTATSGSYAEISARTAVSTQEAAPAGSSVQELWESTELDPEALLGWEPRSASRRLHSRNFRWSVVFVLGTLLGVIAAVSYWIYQRPTTAAEIAGAEVSSQAIELSSALEDLAPLADHLAAGESVDGSELASVAVTVDQASRDLFSSSANLPASEAESRSIAADAATLALDASRHLNDVFAYQVALKPNLTPPPLETDSSFVDLTAAAQDFGDWRSRLINVREALPGGVATGVTESFDELLASLESVQSAYLDALRSEARFAAAGVVVEIEAEMVTIGSSLDGAIVEAATGVVRQIQDAREKLDRLVG